MATINLPWYTKENYNQIQRVVIDDPNFRLTYFGWLDSMRRLEEKVIEQGSSIFWINIDANEYLAWYKAMNENSPTETIDINRYTEWRACNP